MRKEITSVLLSAALGVGGSALVTWRTVSNLKIEVSDLKQEIEREQRRIDDHQKDISSMYTLGGKLDILIGEVQNLRTDIRAKKDK